MSDNSNIRPMTEGDRKYVLQSYLYDMKESPVFSTKQGEPYPGLINDDYFGYQHKLFVDMILRSAKKGAAYMCCEPGQNHLFRGFLIAEAYENMPIVHFVKVKKGAQNQGVATALLEKFYKDFGFSREEHNMFYTQPSKDLHRKPWVQKWVRSWNGVYFYWYPFLAADPDWDR
jgi:GNAT superfamily N-acetyltransferase